MENKFKAGDKVRLISKEKSDIESTNWIVCSDENSVEIGDIFTFTQYGSNNEWINLEELVYAHPIDKFKKVIIVPDSYMLGSEYDDVEKFPKVESALDKVIVINPTDKVKYAEEFDRLTDSKVIPSEVYDSLVLIQDRDYMFSEELRKLIVYLGSTYKDKYEDKTPNAFNPRELMTPEVCMFNVSKYLRRYTTSGFSKSNNPQDVLKSIHYLLLSLNKK